MPNRAVTSLLTRLSHFAERHAGKIVILLLLTMVPSVYLASGLVFRENFGDLLPQDAPAVVDLNRVKDRAGGAAYIIVAVGAEDRPVAERFAVALEESLSSHPDILYVEGRLDVGFLEDRQLLFVDEEKLEELVDDTAHAIDKKNVESTGLFVDLEEPSEAESLDTRKLEETLEDKGLPEPYLVGKDGRYLYCLVRVRGESGDLDLGNKVFRDIQAVVAKLRDGARFPRDLEIAYTGSVVIRTEDNAILQKDLKTAGVLGFIAVVLLLTLYTRRPRTLILVSLPLLAGVSWTFAFARLAIGHLNIITGFLAAILFGLGIDFSIHMFLRYIEERRRGASASEANVRALEMTGRSVFAGAITTAAAFYTVRYADFRGYNEFGLLSAVGILLMFGASVVSFPALNTLLERAFPIRVDPACENYRAGIHLPRWVRTAILIGVPLFGVFSAYEALSGNVRFRTNWRELKGESPASDFDDYMAESLGGTFSLTFVYVDDLEKVPAVTDVVRDISERRKDKGLSSGIKRTLSVLDLVPPDQDARQDQIEALAQQLERVDPDRLDDEERDKHSRAITLTKAQPFALEDLPASLRRKFETVDGHGTLMVITTDYQFYELDEIVAWSDEMQAIRDELDRRGLKAAIMSENWAVGAVFKVMIGDGPFIMWSAFVAIFIVLLIDFRNPRDAFLVLSPLALGIFCIAGGMALFGLELNFMNSVVVPCTVGIGVDNAIHIYHRYKQEGLGSTAVVLRHSASATMLASFTTMLGFGAMIIAHHRGIRSVAELALVSITTTYICTSVFFPLALEAWERFRGVRIRDADPI